MKRIYPIEEACIGCRLCEIACVVEHSRSKDPIRAFKEESPRPIPKNFVEENGPVSFSVNCRHCEDPPCVEACIAGAMVQDFTTGKVIHIADKCVGCWSCIMTCPYGAIKQNLEGTRVIKCDLCPGREIPACVSACPNRALLYQEG